MITKYYRVDRREICFLRFVLEACDGIAVLTTVDPALGLVAIHIPPGCEKEVDSVLEGLKNNILIEKSMNGSLK